MPDTLRRSSLAISRGGCRLTTRRGRPLAQDTKANARRLFEFGAATSLDVIDANLSVFFAQVELTRAELDVVEGEALGVDPPHHVGEPDLRQDRDAVPPAVTVQGHLVAELTHLRRREAGVGDLGLLEADRIRRGVLQLGCR